MVADMGKSLDFYVGGLGFELKKKWEPNGTIEWCWLYIDYVALMLQEYRANIPTIKKGEGVTICFICQDALVIYQQALAKGLAVDEPFVGNNYWVVGLRDPDGYLIIFESPTEVPEETTYSDHNRAKGNLMNEYRLTLPSWFGYPNSPDFTLIEENSYDNY